MKYSKKQLLLDNKFKIGFEFEFVAYALQDILDGQRRKLRVSELYLNEMNTCFSINKQEHNDIKNIIAYSGFNTNKFDYYTESNSIISYGPDRLIALLGLMPTKSLYRKVNVGYKDVTDEIKDKISSTNRTDYNDLISLIRTLRRCYVDTPLLGKYTSLTSAGEEEAYDTMIRVFKDLTGILLKRVKSHDDATKKNHAWYLTEEYVDDIKEDCFEFGFEIVTPPLHPVEALKALRTVLDFISSDDNPFNIRTGVDCGVHINISHEDKTIDNINQTFYSLMFDQDKVIKLFGRSKNYMCASLKPSITREIQRLTREKAITLDTLNDPTTTQRVLDIIESFSDTGGLKSARFYSMKDYGYIEYRMAGGKKYETKYDEIEALIIDLLRFTMKYRTDNTKNKVFIGKIRNIMKSAGAKKGTGKSVIESLPDFLNKFSIPKRTERGDSKELSEIRDV